MPKRKKNNRKWGLGLFSVILLLTVLYLLAEFSDNILAWYGTWAFIGVVLAILIIFFVIYRYGHRSV